MEILNNRELAILAWAGIIFLILIMRNKTRDIVKKSSQDILRSLLQPVLLKFFASYASYFLLCLFCLSGFHLWDLSLLKSALIWFFSVGIVTAFKISSIDHRLSYFKEWVLDNLKVIIVLEYIIALYAFSFVTEFALVPVLSLIAIIGLMAEKDEKNKSVKILSDYLLFSSGLFLMSHALIESYIDFKNLATAQTVKDLSGPFILSIAMLPFLYAFYVYTAYERVFAGIKLSIKNDQLRRKAQVRAAITFGSDIDFLERWRRKTFLSDIKTVHDLKKSFSDIKKIKEREKNRPSIDIHIGWSPPPEHQSQRKTARACAHCPTNRRN